MTYFVCSHWNISNGQYIDISLKKSKHRAEILPNGKQQIALFGDIKLIVFDLRRPRKYSGHFRIDQFSQRLFAVKNALQTCLRISRLAALFVEISINRLHRWIQEKHKS